MRPPLQSCRHFSTVTRRLLGESVPLEHLGVRLLQFCGFGGKQFDRCRAVGSVCPCLGVSSAEMTLTQLDQGGQLCLQPWGRAGLHAVPSVGSTKRSRIGKKHNARLRTFVLNLFCDSIQHPCRSSKQLGESITQSFPPHLPAMGPASVFDRLWGDACCVRPIIVVKRSVQQLYLESNSPEDRTAFRGKEAARLRAIQEQQQLE